MAVGDRKPIDVSAWTGRWMQGGSAAGERFRSGVQQNKSQHANSVAAEGRYAQEVQRAVAEKRRLAGVQASSQQVWAARTADASGRWQASFGVASNQEKVARAASALKPEYERIRSEMDAKYPADGKARMNYWHDELVKLGTKPLKA